MEKEEGCFLAILIWGLTIAISVGSGIAAWQAVEPDSFLGAVFFIILWVLLFRAILYIIGIIVTAIFDR